MSNALAIASVTAVLKDLLNNGLIDHKVDASVGEVIVSTLPPDRIDALDSQKKSRLNLFMYQVTPNVGWRNVGLPARNGNGDRVRNPPLALDLHYLLSAYGAEELHAEILLGYGMQLFHETPVLTREAIRRSLAPPSPVTAGGDLPPAMAALFTSELADQVERRGGEVKYAIHPVAGRMPGHMNVLLAEANIPYEKLLDMEEINHEFSSTDVAVVIGANDVVNPAARSDKASPIYGMPILDVDKARSVFVLKRGKGKGFAGIENALFFDDKTRMLYGDAKSTLTRLVNEMKAV